MINHFDLDDFTLESDLNTINDFVGERLFENDPKILPTESIRSFVHKMAAAINRHREEVCIRRCPIRKMRDGIHKFRLPVIDKQNRNVKFFYFDLTNLWYMYLILLPQWREELLEQFTGLRDSNNSPIYEGDILRVKIDTGSEIVAPVVRDIVETGYCVKYNGELYRFNISKNNHKLEILGNIHENMDLLEDNAYGKPCGGNDKK